MLLLHWLIYFKKKKGKEKKRNKVIIERILALPLESEGGGGYNMFA